MTWTWKEIEDDWLSGGQVAYEPQKIVEAFDRVEEAFGRHGNGSTRFVTGSRASKNEVPVASPG